MSTTLRTRHNGRIIDAWKSNSGLTWHGEVMTPRFIGDQGPFDIQDVTPLPVSVTLCDLIEAGVAVASAASV